MNIPKFMNLKKERKISMLTCYDSSFAAALEGGGLDALLVGDSVAMTLYGFEDTTHATLSMMCRHTAAVRKKYKGLIVSDLPFLSAQKEKSVFLEEAKALMEAGANAIKIEGVEGIEENLKALKSAGFPFMGHLGLTPQSVNALGGFKVQGREAQAQEKIKQDALKIQELGAFALVLECVPSTLAKEITGSLEIPTIGIGAGMDTDGQILVLQDLLGLSEAKFKFVKRYQNFTELTQAAVGSYVQEVQESQFPKEENSFS